MKEISIEEVEHVARLSRLILSSEEKILFQKQLSETINYIGIISEIEAKFSAKNATYQVGNLRNVFREDEVDAQRILTQAEALKNAPLTYRGYFVVPGIFLMPESGEGSP